MNAAIEKRTKRNSKLRDAIDLIGYGHKRIEGDQVERIIAEGIAGLAIALALLMPTDALAQSRTSGRVSGRTSTGSSGTTTIYDAGGRSVGTVTTQQKREERR
jgi:uncharacterized membrane protein